MHTDLHGFKVINSFTEVDSDVHSRSCAESHQSRS